MEKLKAERLYRQMYEVPLNCKHGGGAQLIYNTNRYFWKHPTPTPIISLCRLLITKQFLRHVDDHGPGVLDIIHFCSCYADGIAQEVETLAVGW